MKNKITILIEPIEGGGFMVESDDLPELNIFVRESASLTDAIPEAIKYLYWHNHQIEVTVLMEVPPLGKPHQQVPKGIRREIELKLAA